MLKSKKSKQSVTLMLIDRPASQKPCLVKTKKNEREIVRILKKKKT